MTDNVITLHVLRRFFPEDTVWAFNRSEITGYSVKNKLHFTIEDACCRHDDCLVMLTIYKENPGTKDWMPTIDREYPIKYFDFEYIVYQGSVNIFYENWTKYVPSGNTDVQE